MKKSLLSVLMLLASICASADGYTTNGDGNEYNFKKLSEISGSGVIYNDGVYIVRGICTIANGDHFAIDNGAVIEFDDDGELVIQGTADLQSAGATTVLRRHAESTGCIGISVQSSNRTKVENLSFDYVGLRGQGTAGMDVSGCSFANHSGNVSSALFVGGSGASFDITNCTFDHCRKAAVGGAANYVCILKIDDCTFTSNSQANGNVPQLNLTASESIEIHNCTIIGDSTLTMVGGIGIANWLGTDGMYANISGCTIKDNRYGITTIGIMEVDITDNILVNNKFEKNANNGGSGISLYDPYYKQKATISGNHIERNLWGITVIGCGEVNIGKTEVDSNAPDYNPGNNIFKDNGNGGTAYDLYNNSSNTVYAQGNIWSVPTQDGENIETVIYHKTDDASLGEVIYLPAGDPSGIRTATIERHPAAIYRIDGTKVDGTQYDTLPHGMYIINGKKVLR